MSEVVLTGPSFGITGIPEGEKETGRRVDFRATQFDLVIETKGYRLAWTRAAQCPCVPVNDQTEQPDPNCPSCDGKGWFYFGPQDYAVSEELVGQLDAVQRAVVDKDGAAVVRGVMTGLSTQPNAYDQLGQWTWGTSQVTVRAPNRLGYYDRLVMLDSEAVFAEKILAGDPTTPLALRYPATGVNLLASLARRYTVADFEVVGGEVRWLLGRAPATGTQLTAHYLMHPTWLVIEHPHSMRTTALKRKILEPVTPRGDPTFLPVQALVRLEFLVGRAAA